MIAGVPALAEGVIHVWNANLDVSETELTPLRALLDPAERARAERFHFERDRRRFTGARGRLRRLLEHYTGVPAGELIFAYGPRGKPRLAAALPAVGFNVSHSGGHALFAFARGPEIGVDIEAGERLGDDLAALAQRIFSEREHREWCARPESQRRSTFLSGWTRKEAYLKATGQGIAVALCEIETGLGGGKPAALATGNPDAVWTVYDLPAPAGCAAALAAKGGPVEIRRFPE